MGFEKKFKISNTHKISVYIAGIGLILSFAFSFMYGYLEPSYLQGVYLTPQEEEIFLRVLDKTDEAVKPIIWMSDFSMITGLIAFVAVIIAMFTMKIQYPREITVYYEPKPTLPEAQEKFCLFCGAKMGVDETSCPSCKREQKTHAIKETPEKEKARKKKRKEKYCIFCGETIPAISDFCEKCGKKVSPLR